MPGVDSPGGFDACRGRVYRKISRDAAVNSFMSRTTNFVLYAWLIREEISGEVEVCPRKHDQCSASRGVRPPRVALSGTPGPVAARQAGSGSRNAGSAGKNSAVGSGP